MARKLRRKEWFAVDGCIARSRRTASPCFDAGLRVFFAKDLVLNPGFVNGVAELKFARRHLQQTGRTRWLPPMDQPVMTFANVRTSSCE